MADVAESRAVLKDSGEECCGMAELSVGREYVPTAQLPVPSLHVPKSQALMTGVIVIQHLFLLLGCLLVGVGGGVWG